MKTFKILNTVEDEIKQFNSDIDFINHVKLVATENEDDTIIESVLDATNYINTYSDNLQII